MTYDERAIGAFGAFGEKRLRTIGRDDGNIRLAADNTSKRLAAENRISSALPVFLSQS
jgi:hypothetical protein